MIVLSTMQVVGATIGEIRYNLDHWSTLELPWMHNKNDISCIPNGIYPIIKQQDHFDILEVPGRWGIEIHVGNYTHQIQGCILPGLSHADINNDGVVDVKNSRKAMDAMLKILPDEGFILIQGRPY